MIQSDYPNVTRLNFAAGMVVLLGLLSSPAANAADPPLAGADTYQLKIDVAAHRLVGQVIEAAKDTGETAQRVVDPPRVSSLGGKPFAAQIGRAAFDADLDPALVHAVIFVESRYNPAARSPKGALGLMQVMPQTASRYGIKNATRSIDENLRAGTRYLSDLMRQFAGRVDLVLAAYNAGENAVVRHLGIPPYQETRRYVPAVMAKYEEWRDVPAVIEPPTPAPPLATVVRVEYLPGTRLESASNVRVP